MSENFEPQEAPEQEAAPRSDEGWATHRDEDTMLLISYRPYGTIQQFIVTAGASPGMIIGVERSDHTENGAAVRIDVTGFDDSALADFFEMLADKIRTGIRIDVPQEIVDHL